MRSTLFAALFAALAWICPASLRALEETIEPLPPDIVRIREAGELRVAQFGGTRPGFFFFVEGEMLDAAKKAGVEIYDYEGQSLVGHDVEMALSLAREIGVPLRIVRGYPDFSATVGAVAAGGADIAMSKLSKTLPRAVTAELTRPYFRADITVIVNRVAEEQLSRRSAAAEADTLSRLANDKEITLGVIPGTSQMQWTVSVFPGAALREYPDQDALFGGVQSGEVTAVLYEEFEARRFFRLWPDMALSCRMIRHPYLTDLMIYATRPGDDGMKRLVDAWLDRQRLLSTDEILDRFETMMVKDASKRLGSSGTGAGSGKTAAAGSAVAAAALLLAWLFFARPPKRSEG
jgi:ABC-type amino acid transport substrate-binding protein